MRFLDNIIGRYKNIRSMRELNQTYTRQYALIGFGNHCVSNLLPVIQYLQLPLKYICCTSERKAALISQKYKDIKGTTSLQEILHDESISGVFVAAHPQAHFQIASEVIKSGKSLFIEKPPCRDERELKVLIDTIKNNDSQHTIVGLQRRFAPATQILQKRLKCETKRHYHYRYLTGLYPEGDALLDLFIHPLDYVVLLFGQAKIKVVDITNSKDGGQTLFLILEHQELTGMLELSTDYSWQDALGIPLEKVFRNNSALVNLYGRNAFVPTVGNNQIVTQGFFSEIKTFADVVENRCKNTLSYSLESVEQVYSLIAEIKEHTSKK